MRLRYQTYEFDLQDLHVRTLRDRQEYDDPDGKAEKLGITSENWALFGVVWESAEVLARLMWSRKFQGERILEIGCGIGLASLVLTVRNQDISASDRHPETQLFLDYNSNLNDLPLIPFELCDWQQPQSTLGTFDLIIGSDLLYDHGSLKPLAQFIKCHARQRCEIMLIDPNRSLRAQFSKEMTKAGFDTDSRTKVINGAPDGYKGCVLKYSRTANQRAT